MMRRIPGGDARAEHPLRTVGVALLVCLFTVAVSARSEARPPNVLFIVVDDLRPELGVYGRESAKTPHIDRLAREGLVFERAYAQQAKCLPSRSSLLTGLRPDTAGVGRRDRHFREVHPDLATLPGLFKAHGYRTVGLGKVFHLGRNDPRSWTESVERPLANAYQSPENQALVARKLAAARAAGASKWELPGASTGPAFESHDGPDAEYVDARITRLALAELRKPHPEPWFLAVGYLKPHLPFNAPARYWKLYDPAAIPLAANREPPANAPAFALPPSAELRSYEGIPDTGPLAPDLERSLIHGYLACVSFIDAQVGALLDELDRKGLRDDTIVVLFGDHGMHLGELGAWGKHSNFETATRTPLILSVPSAGARARGVRTQSLVELVDLYPTLVELAGLPRPVGLEGVSLAPLLADPERDWKTAAFSQIARGDLLGHSIRTDRYRFTRWTKRGREQAVELYDLREDPFEARNIAAQPGLQASLTQLAARLRAGWRNEQPPPAVNDHTQASE